MVPKPKLIVTVDVEDWPQSTLNHDLPIGNSCAENTRRILDLLEHFPGARGTFFILGKVLDKHPDLVRHIQRNRHEIACHGYGHVKVTRLTRSSFAEELHRETGKLSDFVGQRLQGYRAPDFSISSNTLWALDLLAEEGYSYDSSIFPVTTAHYGIHDWPTDARHVMLPGGLSIVEFPLTVLTLLGKRLPVSGGGYARLLPCHLLRLVFMHEAHRRSIPPVFYFHPYEFDPGEFRRLSVRVPWRIRLHQGLGRSGFARKVKSLFESFECCSVADVLAGSPKLPSFDAARLRNRTQASIRIASSTPV
ncbi:MAG TPA: polysaccharide deacetylase family protein [Terracidiphilus sp.]|nr:polysaccharide deacetylase family protein [Terracidiphilus sp.]